MRLNLTNKIKTNSGVYVIKFPNNKVYIGSSNNIKRRVHEHIYNLYKNQKLWYRTAALENNFELPRGLSYKQQCRYLNNCPIILYTYECSDYREQEQKLLSSIKKEDRQYCYNQSW